MAISKKPNWWGKSVLTTSVFQKLKKAIIILFVSSIAIGGAFIFSPYRTDLNNLSRFFSANINFFTFVIIISAFFYSIFFFFRAFSNLLKLNIESNTQKKKQYRALFIEGTIGFFVNIILVVSINYLLNETNKLW